MKRSNPDITVDNKVKVLLCGTFDLFHYGHVRAFKQAKELFPNTWVIAGVWKDEIVQQNQGDFVLSQKERAEVVQSCRYVDEVLLDTPFTPDQVYLAKYDIAFLLVEDHIKIKTQKVSEDSVKIVKRTQGISSTEIITRIVRDYERYLRRNWTRGTNLTSMNVSLFRKSSLEVREGFGKMVKGWTGFIMQGFLKEFAQKSPDEKFTLIGLLKHANIARVFGSPIRHDEESMEKEKPHYLEIVKPRVSGWNSINISDIEVKKVQGGLTNLLTKVTICPAKARNLPKEIPRHVLVRQYGMASNSVIKRDVEHIIFEKFSAMKLGPCLHGYYPGGRVEEYIESTTLTIEDFPQYISLIARKIAKIHHCEIPELNHSPALFDTLLQWATTARGIREREIGRDDDDLPQYSFFGRTTLSKLEHQKQQRHLWNSLDVDLIIKEIIYMRDILENSESESRYPIIFCHNDLNAGNMLRTQTSDGNVDIMIIDYEYGSYNYRGFDLGNFFCEWMMNYRVSEYPNFKIQTELWPTPSQQYEYFKEYIAESKRLEGRGNVVVTTGEINALKEETELFSLCSHLLWCLWGITQYGVSELQFGFLEFSLARFELYLKTKRKILGVNTM